jgi:hypothetical protein
MPLSGAISEGLRTTVQPAASAGATLHMIWLMGQFQGVIMPTTPTGSYSVAVVPCTVSNAKLQHAERGLQVRHAHGRLRGLGQPQRRAHLQRDGLRHLSARRLYTSSTFSSRDALSRVVREALERPARGLHGLVHVGCRAQADARDDLLVGGLMTSRLRALAGSTHWPSM